jgi:gliding motility-associated-like protein
MYFVLGQPKVDFYVFEVICIKLVVMKTHIFSRIVTCLFIVFCSFYSLSKNIYVNDASTVGDVWCIAISGSLGTVASPYSTLKTALTNAVSGDVIYVDAGNYTEKYLSAKSGVTVIGAGAYKTTFIGSGSSGIWFMKIDGVSNFSISNITARKYLNNDGSAGQIFTITNSSSNIKINNVLLAKNDGSNGDAGIYIGTGSSNIILDSISGSCQNTSSSGTAIVVDGKNISVFIKNSLFSGNNNSNQGSNGSAIRVKADVGSTPNVVLNIENSVFSENTAKKGGAIYIEGGSVTINKCKFLGNKTTETGGTEGGGAIWISKTNTLCTISNSEFINNVAAADGGAIQVYTLVNPAEVKIENCLFENNSAVNGNDIHTRLKSGKKFNVTVNNCMFKSVGTNIVSGPATAIPCDDGILTITNSGSPGKNGLVSTVDASCKSVINLDNLTSGYVAPADAFPGYQGCPNAAICNSAKPGTTPTIICPTDLNTTVTLTATGPSNSKFTWYDVPTGGASIGTSTSASSNFVASIPSLASGTKIFYVVSDLDNCQIRVPITLTCSTCTTPTPTWTSSATSACPNAKVKYATTALKSPYVWTIPGISGTDYTIVSGGTATSDTLIIKWLTKGDKIVKVGYTENSCVSPTPASITTKVSDLSTGVFIAQPSTNSCQNAPIIYAADKNYTNFNWQITGVLGTDYEIVAGGKTTDDTLIIKWKTLGAHTVKLDYTASGGCTTTTPATYTTTVVARPKLPVSPFQDTVQPICTVPTGSVLLNLPSIGNWTISSIPKVGNAKVVNNQLTYRFGDLIKKTQYKFFVVDANGCYSDTTSEVTMNDIPGQPEIFGADTICMANNLTLKAWTDNTKTTASTPNATNPWVSSDNTIATVSNLGVVKSLNISGKVRITYTDNANCTQFDSIVVASKAVSGTTSFTVDTICESISKSIVLSGFTPSYTIQWQDSIAGSGVWIDIPNETSATFNTPTSLSPGNYFYRAVVKNTFCSDNAISKLVKVVVTSKSAPTFATTDIIQPTCLVATGGVKSNMQYKGVWTIKATADPLSTGVTKDTTGTVNVIPYALSLKGLNPGKYIFQVTNSKGCTSNPSSEIDIKTQPIIPAKPELDLDTIYCASNSYTLDKIVFKPKPNLSASESIKYYDKNGVVITNPKLVTVIPNESYTFVFNNAYCDSKDKLTTIIPFDNGPTLPLSGGDILLTNICAFEKPNFNTLFAKIPGIDTTQFKFYITPDKSIIPISILPNTTIIGSNGGALQTMFYTLADKKNGCKNNVFAKLTFTLDEGPTGLTLKPKQIFCEASLPTVANLDITELTPSNATTSLVWYATFGATNSLSASTNLVSMTYFAALKENGGCESIDRKSVLVDIQIFGQTTLDLSNISFCKGSNKTFADLSITPYSYPNFVWLDAYKVVQQLTTKLISGKYFAAETKNGCVSDKSQEIDVKFESPIISIAPTKLPTCGVGNGALKVVGGVTGYTYKWSKNATPMTDIGDQIFNLPFDYTIKYSVIVEDTKGCKAYDTTQFSDCEPPGIPHVLTLNKDGKNDVFKLHYDTKYPKCKLSIFNRWGSMVYESKDIPYKDDWDGKPNAAGTLGSGELPTGTYFYLIDKGDGSALESGYIELVK